jgi:hypothetical protein
MTATAALRARAGIIIRVPPEDITTALIELRK